MFTFSTLPRTSHHKTVGERRSQHRIEQRYYERHGTAGPGAIYHAIRRFSRWPA